MLLEPNGPCRNIWVKPACNNTKQSILNRRRPVFARAGLGVWVLAMSRGILSSNPAREISLLICRTCSPPPWICARMAAAEQAAWRRGGAQKRARFQCLKRQSRITRPPPNLPAPFKQMIPANVSTEAGKPEGGTSAGIPAAKKGSIMCEHPETDAEETK